MWILSMIGTFSIVSDGDSLMIVQSGTRGDMLRLKQYACPELSELTCEPEADLPWRATCERQAWENTLNRLSSMVSYASFEDEVTRSLGEGRARLYAKATSAMSKMPEDLAEKHPDERTLPWGTRIPPGRKLSYGGILVSPDGRFLLREVANHYDGYVWTFAKGTPGAGESARTTALRKVFAETGIRPHVLLPIPGEFTGGTTLNRYFLMTVDPQHLTPSFTSKETQSLRWALAHEARDLIKLTKNIVGRKRDLEVLDVAVSYLPSPQPLQRLIATSKDWRIRPMPAQRIVKSFGRTFDRRQMAQIIRGFCPESMEDRIFAWFEDCVLHLHRSWTGHEMFRLYLEFDGNAWLAKTVEVNRGESVGKRDLIVLERVLQLVLERGEELDD